MSLISLTYISTAIRPMSTLDIMDILNVSRTKNATLDITGMLLYRDGFFMQVLEGEHTAVEPLFYSITKDTRHHHILLVEKVPITGRSFSDWSMAFNNLDKAGSADLAGFSDFLSTRLDPHFLIDHPARARSLLVAFKNEVLV